MLFKILNLEYKIENRSILEKKNFTVEKNKHVLLLGPSGCGKTTLINLMTGLLKPSSGEIFFENKNFSFLSDQEIDDFRSENFGLIFQKLHLIKHLNVEQNITLAKNKSHSLNINELINDLGLSGKNKQMAKDLSVGESQRVAIARGIANHPKVIFADEPTSALDQLNTKKVIELIFSQARKTNATLIVSTHDNRIKKYFSNIVEFNHE
ncbi:ATP-binding cassette domain-containing protein [Rickettsiales bacterium]|nr:ATP-binding cassette domain-containing protein [Rickettsiales bacterium]